MTWALWVIDCLLQPSWSLIEAHKVFSPLYTTILLYSILYYYWTLNIFSLCKIIPFYTLIVWRRSFHSVWLFCSACIIISMEPQSKLLCLSSVRSNVNFHFFRVNCTKKYPIIMRNDLRYETEIYFDGTSIWCWKWSFWPQDVVTELLYIALGG